ncbi:MAG: Gfo/Idh/MocA family oxidoreductase [Clostridiaceae bacterium]|jgi:hypothetical protein|nr:Gfo/Idh/MocA family oxidoreductase [Clostridiaceae bacterium]
MNRIGFIDYFLDEWHANNYPAWIRASSQSASFDVALAWAAKDKPGGLTTEQWCERHQVEAMPSLEALVEASDCIVLLSPDNPEQHEALAKLPLGSGKPVYIDKTFAPDAAAAKRLFDLAERHRTPLYSTSALRYARELSWLDEKNLDQQDIVFAAARGPGVLDNYVIHQLEMIVKAMGTGAVRALASGSQDAPLVLFEYADGRSCQVNHLPWAGFSLALQAGDGQGAICEVKANFWQPFIEDLLTFFATGRPPVPAGETCAAMAMREAALKAVAQPGTWIAVPD